MISKILTARAEIDARFEAAGLGNAADYRAYLASRKNVGSHTLQTPFDAAAADRILDSCVRLSTLPAERERLSADKEYKPIYQAMRFELMARLGVATAITGAEVAMAIAKTPDLTIFINSMCGCASGGVRNAIALAAKDQRLVPGLFPMIAVMDVGDCKGEAAPVSVNANTLATQRGADYARGLLGAQATDATRPAPAFLVLRAGEAAAFVTRNALDQKSPEVIVQRLVQATS